MKSKIRLDKESVLSFLNVGMTKKGIAYAMRVCRRTIDRRLTSRQQRQRGRCGRPPKIRERLGKAILNVLSENPFLTQQQTSTIVGGIHRSTISRFLKRSGWSKTKAQIQPARRTEEKAMAWMRTFSPSPLNDFLALDETSFVNTRMTELFGWSPKGKACVVEGPVSQPCRKRLTLLVAIDANSNLPLHHIIIEGSAKSVHFQSFIESLPDHVKGKRMLLDNVSIHHATHSCHKNGKPSIKETADKKGLKLEYLPPYSPQYNPTELVFAGLKRRVRLVASECNTIQKMTRAVESSMSEPLGNVGGMFEKCLWWLRWEGGVSDSRCR
jgi:transposase